MTPVTKDNVVVRKKNRAIFNEYPFFLALSDFFTSLTIHSACLLDIG